MAVVVVVEDNLPDQQFMASLLKYAGHQVMLCSDGRAGLEVIKKVRPGLVITDLITPGLDGYELARAVRRHPGTASTPIILETAHYLESEVRRIAAQIGIQQVIIKPFEPQTFLDTVATTLLGKAVEAPVIPQATGDDAFHVEHLRLITTKLYEKVRELELARQELADDADVYRLLFRVQPEPAWIFDLGTLRFVEVNEAAVRRYGYSRDDFLGMTIKDLAASPAGPASPAMLHSESSGRRLHRKKDGTAFEVQTTTQDVTYYGQRSRYVLAHALESDGTQRLAARSAVDEPVPPQPPTEHAISKA